jgi:hypothetical protein
MGLLLVVLLLSQVLPPDQLERTFLRIWQFVRSDIWPYQVRVVLHRVLHTSGPTDGPTSGATSGPTYGPLVFPHLAHYSNNP